MKRIHLIYIMAAMLGFVSCIEPPLHLPGQDLAVDVQVAQTELNLVWDNEVQIEHEWYYGWDLKDDSIWGGLAYPHPSSYEVYRYYKGDDPLAKHSGVDVFTIDNNRFRRYFQFGYYDMLFYSNIDSQDGTQVLVIKESADSVIATTTGTRGLSRSILNASRADEGDAPLGVLNQPEIFYACYSENVYISPDLKDYEYDPVENVYIKHLQAELRPLVYIYLVQFILLNNDDGRIKGINGNAAISSMAASTNLYTGHTSNQPTLVYFNTRMKENREVDGKMCDVFGGKLTTFGLCDNEPYTRSGALTQVHVAISAISCITIWCGTTIRLRPIRPMSPRRCRPTRMAASSPSGSTALSSPLPIVAVPKAVAASSSQPSRITTR